MFGKQICSYLDNLCNHNASSFKALNGPRLLREGYYISSNKNREISFPT